MNPVLLLAPPLLLLAACGDNSAEVKPVPGGDVAEKLDRAADQSGPVAAGVLRDAAEEARERPSLAPVDKSGSFAQDALQKAGDAAAKADGASASPRPTHK